MLVLSPTRELALQIEAECKKYRYKDYARSCTLPLHQGSILSLRESWDDLDDLSHLLPVSASTAAATGGARSTWWRVEWTLWSPRQDDSTTSRWTSSLIWSPSLTWSAASPWNVPPYAESTVWPSCAAPRCWMRLTACWTWALNLRSWRSFWTSVQTDKLSWPGKLKCSLSRKKNRSSSVNR